MLVLCTSRSGAGLTPLYLASREGYHSKADFPITVGKTYVVLAVGLRDRQVWFYLDDDDQLPYPVGYPACLFEIVVGSVSQYWNFVLTPDSHDHHALLAPVAWCRDPFFYDRLTDGDAATFAEFTQQRLLIQNESVEVLRTDSGA